MRRALPIVSIALVVAGCGGDGGGGDRSAAPDSPEAAVQAFTAAVEKGDWKAACGRLANAGQAALTTELGAKEHAFVPPSEQDEFGQLKDCAATLGKRATAVMAIFKGSGSANSSQKQTATKATVTTPQGAWTVTIESPSKLWRVASFPHG